LVAEFFIYIVPNEDNPFTILGMENSIVIAVGKQNYISSREHVTRCEVLPKHSICQAIARFLHQGFCKAHVEYL